MSLVEIIWSIIRFIFSIILILGAISVSIKVITFTFNLLLLIKSLIGLTLRFIKNTLMEAFNSMKEFLSHKESKGDISTKEKNKGKTIPFTYKSDNPNIVTLKGKPLILCDLTCNIKKLEGLKKLYPIIRNYNKQLMVLKEIENLETIVREDNNLINKITSCNLGLYYFYNYKLRDETDKLIIYRHLILRGNKIFLLNCSNLDNSFLLKTLHSFGVNYNITNVVLTNLPSLDNLFILLQKELFTEENNRIGVLLSQVEDKSPEDILNQYKLNAIDFR